MKRKWYFSFVNQWAPLFDNPETYNWIDVSIASLRVESSPYKNSKEIEFGLLGFVLTITRLDNRPESE